MTRTGVIRTASVGVLLCGTCWGTSALSQNVPDQKAAIAANQAEEGTSEGMAEVIVTAQRRAERLQDVPIAVTAVTKDLAQDFGIDTTAQLPAITPGLSFTRENNGVTTFLRGIGTPQPTGSENAVSVYVDGIYYPTPQSSAFALPNIERVEILKGPQGTLFGRNSTGGVIQVITQDPHYAPSADVRLDYGRFGTFEGSAYATTGISDTIATGISVEYQNQSDGWGRNLVTGQGTYITNELGLRSKTIFEPGEGTKLTLMLDYHRARQGQEATLFPNSVPIDHSAYPGFYNTRENVDQYTVETDYGAALRMDQKIGALNFVSLTSYRTVDNRLVIDQDHTKLDLISAHVRVPNPTFTQELQLLSPSGSWLNWITGLYYFNNKIANDPQDVLGFALAPAVESVRNALLTVQSYAGFMQGTVPVWADTNLTLGARYTIDRRSIDGTVTNFLRNGTPLLQSFPVRRRTWSEPTWRASLDHRFSEALMIYISYNRGFRSGNFNLSSPGEAPVNPEKLDAYEMGFKGNLIGNKLILDGAAFLYNAKNLQLTRGVPGGMNVNFNATAARIKGLELSLAAAPVSDLTLTSAVSLLDGHYNAFPNAVFFLPKPAGGNFTVLGQDASGRRTVQTPKITFNFGVVWRVETRLGLVKVSGNYYYNDGFFWDVQNSVRQPSYNLLNGEISLMPVDNWEVALWGRNLLSAKYYARAQAQAIGTLFTPDAPLTFGVSLRSHFH